MPQYDINFNDDDYYDDDWVSKSSIKRHAKDLRKLGEKLVSLSTTEFEQVPFEDDDSLKNACLIAKKLKPQSEEIRRQFLHIEALLRNREEDIPRYEQALQYIAGSNVAGNSQTYKIEQIRNKLINEGMKAINEIISSNPELDRNKLRSLVQKSKQELDTNDQNKKNYKELFKYLRENL